jgi:hypothetical protein
MALGVVGVVGGFLALGVAWFRTAIPETSTQPGAVAGPVSFAPPLAGVPWKRDAEEIGELRGMGLTAAWTPWTAASGRGRPVLPYIVPPVGRSEPERVAEIGAGLGSRDAARVDAAVAGLEKLVAENPLAAGVAFRGTWSVQLMAGKRYEDVARVAEVLLVAYAYDTAALEQLLSLRVAALRAVGRNEEALGAARQLYDVASLAGTAAALGLVEQCLAANYPGEPGRIAALKRSQGVVLRAATRAATTRRAAASSPATATAPAERFSMLEVAAAGDEGRLAAAERRFFGEDLVSLYGRGNLLLLARQPEAAERIFMRACAVASDVQLPCAVESLARCAKARSGAIVEANKVVERVR